MKKLKKYKNLIIAIIVFVLVLVLFFLAYRSFFPDEETAIYGDRLEGIEEVEVTESDQNKIKKAVSESVTESSVRIQGRIIEVNLTIKDEVTRDAAKELGNTILNTISNKQKEYYDIQVFIEKGDSYSGEDASQFPIIGYKHHTNESITWTKDR